MWNTTFLEQPYAVSNRAEDPDSGTLVSNNAASLGLRLLEIEFTDEVEPGLKTVAPMKLKKEKFYPLG